MSFRMSSFFVEISTEAVVPARRIAETKTKIDIISLIGLIVAGLGEPHDLHQLVDFTSIEGNFMEDVGRL